MSDRIHKLVGFASRRISDGRAKAREAYERSRYYRTGSVQESTFLAGFLDGFCKNVGALKPGTLAGDTYNDAYTQGSEARSDYDLNDPTRNPRASANELYAAHETMRAARTPEERACAERFMQRAQLNNDLMREHCD